MATKELPATRLIDTADKSTLIVLLMIPSIDSRIITTDALAIMQDSITIATGSRRVRPASGDNNTMISLFQIRSIIANKQIDIFKYLNQSLFDQ